MEHSGGRATAFHEKKKTLVQFMLNCAGCRVGFGCYVGVGTYGLGIAHMWG